MKHLRPYVIFLSAILGLGACFKRGALDQGKHLRVPLVSDIQGFDPLFAADAYTHSAIIQVYETLLEYDYLKRPYTLKPLLLESLPQVSEDGLTHSFTLRKGIRFHDDKAFKNTPRFLTASDVVFSFKRFADPGVKHPSWWVLGDRIEGLAKLREDLIQGRVKDLASGEVSGLKVLDEQRFEIRLSGPDKQFLYMLSLAPTAVVAPEVVHHYGDELLNHPVGTGPFILKAWTRNQRLEFSKNPHYWGVFDPGDVGQADAPAGLLEAKGQRLPFVDTLTMTIFTEAQPMWLNFLKGRLDYSGVPKDAYDSAFDAQGDLKSDLKDKGISVLRTPGADLVFYVFNMEDPVLGKNKSLRKAISAAFDRSKMISRFYNGRAVEAHSPIPPGFEGHDPNLRNPVGYDVAKAKKWLEEAKKEHQRLTGQKELPEIIDETISGTDSRQMSESAHMDLTAIGLKVKANPNSWPQFSEKLRKRQFQLASYAWNADYPDAETFFQLLYSKNASPGANSANFSHAQYDRLYLKMKNLPDGPERQAIMKQMVQIIHEECPWVLKVHRLNVGLAHAWLKHVNPNPIAPGLYKYWDVDLATQAQGLKRLK